MSSKPTRSDRCCNPYKIGNHVGKYLRYMPYNLRQLFPEFPANSKICNSCRKQDPSNVSQSGNSDKIDEENSTINSSMSSSEVLHTSSNRELELESMLQGIKDKFRSLKISDPLRLRILTVAPDSWSVKKISEEFGCSWQLANKSRDLKKSNGVLGNTIAKIGKPLSNDIVQIIIEFYESNSRIMASVKDCKSVKGDDGRILIQKRLLLLDLKGLYELYVQTYKAAAVSFSKFAQLRPKYCILAGASGTHCVCVCTIHENCKLMLDAVDVEKITADTEFPISNYRDCLINITCRKPTEMCHLGDCKKCSDVEKFRNNLKDLLISKNILEVQYSGWTGTDRSTLITQILPSNEFVEELCDHLLILKPHSFIAKKQTEYFEMRKKNLRPSEILIIMDFSENYKYVIQNASQAFHFNNDQCTIFPVVYYYVEGSEVKHKSMIFMSDSTKHDSAAVFTIQTLLIPYLRKKHQLKKCIYFTDGAKQHFKNRYQMINLVHHETDFGIVAEWHFHATAHGKSPSDGVGALLKREAARCSLLRKPEDAITTSAKLFEWSTAKFPDMKIFYYSRKDHEKMARHLNKRFGQSLAVPQIMKNHAFFVEKKILYIKRFSSDKNSTQLSY